MSISLFVEEQSNGNRREIAFYINGELQFHTADEAIYHEYLTIPAIALAAQRFPNQALRVLVCGGGDGLAVRDILRYPQVNQIDLVDYSQEVIDLGKQVFAPFNQESLSNPKVAIHIQEAFEFLTKFTQDLEENLLNESDRRYHAIICDFTYPASIAETQIYAWEWFVLLKQALIPSGIIATNAVSPDRNTLAFWCIDQTMQAAGLDVKPMQVHIPSFVNHDYGNWGFLLASEMAIADSEIKSLDLRLDLRALSLDALLAAFIFDQAIAQVRDSVIIHKKDSSQLFFYLLNRVDQKYLQDQAIATTQASDKNGDPMNLDNLARAWLKQLESNPDALLIPAQHHSHTPQISQEWLGRVKQLLNQIDLPRLIAKLLERSQALPREVADDLRQFQTKLTSFQQQLSQQNSPPDSSQAIYLNDSNKPSFSLTTAKVIAILSLTLLVANLAAPDAVFAKGSTVFGSSGDGNGISLGLIGLMMTMGGVYWLINLANNPEKK